MATAPQTDKKTGKKKSKKNQQPPYSRETLIRLAQIGAATVKGELDTRIREVEAFMKAHPIGEIPAGVSGKGPGKHKVTPEQLAKMKAGSKAYWDKKKAEKAAAQGVPTDGPKDASAEALSPEVAEIVGATH